VWIEQRNLSADKKLATTVDAQAESAGAVVSEDAFTVLGDGNGLGILPNNLIDNAIRHTPEGGKIDVVLRRRDGLIDMTVSDSGTGIPDSALSRVLDRFHCGEHAKDKEAGLDSPLPQALPPDTVCVSCCGTKETQRVCAPRSLVLRP
jgi:K+-sensing histidine kinase KdpD